MVPSPFYVYILLMTRLECLFLYHPPHLTVVIFLIPSPRFPLPTVDPSDLWTYRRKIVINIGITFSEGGKINENQHCLHICSFIVLLLFHIYEFSISNQEVIEQSFRAVLHFCISHTNKLHAQESKHKKCCLIWPRLNHQT